MKAVLWTGYGGPEVLKIGDIKRPEIKEKEILVKIKQPWSQWETVK